VTNRHALVIGVPRYDDDDFNTDSRLADAVRCDVAAMRAALEPSGYAITECGTTDADRGEATLNRINQAIEDACLTAPPGGVLLIYFSGHGVTVGGRDYLLPSDAYRPRSRPSARPQPEGRPDLSPARPIAAPFSEPPAVRSLVPVVPELDVLADCRARLVAVFVDACRNDQAGAQPSAEPGGQQPYLADGGHFVLVTGCSAGQVCQYDETGSVFTTSLAKMLDPRNPARTLAEVVAEVSKDMGRTSRQRQGEPQEPVVRYPEMLKLAGGVQICDGDELTDAWRKAVSASPLLARCVNPDTVQAVVADCAQSCGAAQDTLRKRTGITDPWTDQNYPGRVLRFTEFLLRDAGLLPAANPAPGAGKTVAPGESLRPGESALLLAAPFLREAVMAEGIREAAGIDPAKLDRTYVPGPRSDLELTHELHQHLVRRATGLRQRAATAGPAPGPAAADQLAMWLVHRWLSSRASLWEGAAADQVYGWAKPLIADCAGSAGDHEVPRLLQAMLLAVGAEPADERLVAKLTSAYVNDRWKLLAAVLWLAGILAVDPRRLPPVVADLIGTRMELPLTDVQDAAGRRADWAPAAAGVYDLSLVCDHPALHDAFEDITRRANRATETIRTRLKLPPSLTDRLPRGITADGLRPATRQDDEPAYNVPLSRFQIAEEKVRELLMGRQLYGEPELAIRELYQNALDACRWRATRQEYLEQTAQSPPPWAGRITFTRGTEDGRPYLDCEDNGVGMDLNTLKHVFANAGERFVYGQEFRAEQAAWAALDPPLRMVSNSQFGVGVFSYFMLADEITVLTRHQDRDGIPDHDAYEVRITSSGSLFQIKPASGLAGCGTRIRLYLSGDVSDISVLKELGEQLMVAEHVVTVTEPGGKMAWEPGELCYQDVIIGPDGNVIFDRVSAEEPLKSGADFWWVPGGGALAADGIRTSREVFGLVANLRDVHRPQFTVDRKTLRSWDEDWVKGQVSDALPALLAWPGFTMNWLWALANDDLTCAQRVFEYAVRAGHNLRTTFAGPPVPLAVVGLVPIDSSLLRGYERRMRGGPRFKAWRAGVWSLLGHNPLGFSASYDQDDRRLLARLSRRLTGFPVPDAIDGRLLSAWAEHSYSDQVDHLRESIDQTGCSIRAGIRRCRRYAITGIDVSGLRGVPADGDEPNSAGHRWAAALTAYPPPAEAEPQELVRALLKAALALGASPADVPRRAREQGVNGWVSPAPGVRQKVADAVAGAERILAAAGDSGSLLYQLDVFAGELTPARVLHLGRVSGRSLPQTLELCDTLAVVGITVAGRDAYPAEFDELETEALRMLPSPGAIVEADDLVRMAGTENVPVGVVYDALARLEARGFLVRPPRPGAPDYQPGARDMDLLNGNMPYSTASALPRQSPLWLRVAAIASRPAGDHDPWKLAAGRLLPYITAPRVTQPELAASASALQTTLGGASVTLKALYPEAELPELDHDCQALTVPWGTRDALLSVGAELSWQQNLAPLIWAAKDSELPLGDFVALLAPFRKLGAPVPPFDEAVRAALNTVTLDEYDLDMLSEPKMYPTDLVPEVRTVSALHLVQTAGRFGWTLREAHERFARLVPAGLTLGYPQVELPDDIVFWYDLLALTTFFDGQPPVISGRIDQAYLEHAADEIFDAPPEELPAKAAFLRERLTRYAPLFQLELPEEDTVG
jgi:hypothetical protein